MRNKAKNKYLMSLAVFAMVSSLGMGALSASSQQASARGEAEVNDSSSSDDSGSDSSSKSSSSSSSKRSSSSSKSSDDSSGDSVRGTFSTSTDARRGATKPEDDGVVSQSVDSRNGATKPEDNGIDNGQAEDSRNGAMKPEDNSSSSINEDMLIDGEDSVVHRSVVAGIVQQLNSVADREGGIGQIVRVVAQQQNDSKERARGAIEKVEKRGKIVTFLFGTDKKSLKELENEIDLTKRNEADIRAAAQKVENADNKNVLLKQADMLKKEKDRLEKIEAAHDEAFSLFGWAGDIFQK